MAGEVDEVYVECRGCGGERGMEERRERRTEGEGG